VSRQHPKQHCQHHPDRPFHNPIPSRPGDEESQEPQAISDDKTTTFNELTHGFKVAKFRLEVTTKFASVNADCHPGLAGNVRSTDFERFRRNPSQSD